MTQEAALHTVCLVMHAMMDSRGCLQEEDLRASAEPVVEDINKQLIAANERFKLSGADALILLPAVEWRSRDVLEAQRQLRVLKSSERCAKRWPYRSLVA